MYQRMLTNDPCGIRISQCENGWVLSLDSFPAFSPMEMEPTCEYVAKSEAEVLELLPKLLERAAKQKKLRTEAMAKYAEMAQADFEDTGMPILAQGYVPHRPRGRVSPA